MAGFDLTSITLIGTNTPEKHAGYALDVILHISGYRGPLLGGLLSHWIGLRMSVVQHLYWPEQCVYEWWDGPSFIDTRRDSHDMARVSFQRAIQQAQSIRS
ncbi:hypothetical protein P5G61_00105 [Paenibacillus sp. F6_3S_P_1C]|uniref:Uncharacterized protein n=1 Tax=Paenibacillus vandeheii TaxID=3035917 RepID=A0ABT8J4X4_9BACL|nr:hypothetical protein [Paenibacillus vandeheii]MDN4599612.1 hypothetical protein [Paenibacillus vandeheii]